MAVPERASSTRVRWEVRARVWRLVLVWIAIKDVDDLARGKPIEKVLRA
jgi:hypothetical protein